ncbi:MAG TPA: hypothetical protein VGC64_08855, partial [Pyrinomonadaceae bacterium]
MLYSLSQLLLLLRTLLRGLSLRLPLRFGLLLHGGALLLLCGYCLLARCLSLRPLIQADTFGLRTLLGHPRSSFVISLRCPIVLFRNRGGLPGGALIRPHLALKLLNLTLGLFITASRLRCQSFDSFLPLIIRG